MAYLESIDTCTISIKSVITDETLDDLILNAIISIRNNKKRPDSNSIFECINRELKNFDITHTLVDTRLSLLTVNEKLEIKYPSGKTSYWIRAESEQDLSTFKTSTRSSPLTCEMPMISLKESNVNNNLSFEERVNWLSTEVIAMQSFIVDQALILKQSLKYSTLEKPPSDISSEVKRLEEVNDIPRQQNESLLQENSSKNAIIQLLIKNQEYLNKSVCNWKSVLDVDEIFKTVPKSPLKQGNNTETSRINCSYRFEVFSRTDDDDNNDSKSRKSDNIITEESFTNDDVSNRKNKTQKSCITNTKHKKKHYPRRTTHSQTITDVKILKLLA